MTGWRVLPPSGNSKIEIPLRTRPAASPNIARRGPGAFAAHRDMTCTVQVPAKKRNFPQIIPRQNPKFPRHTGEHHRGIDQTEVIRAEHAGLLGIELLRAEHANPDHADVKNHPRPGYRDPVL